MITVLDLLWDPLSSWVEVSGPIILFGLYYGFIATLPFGPSKIYSMRSFFLGEALYGIIAISGSITGQLIVFLSMYYSPIYAAFWKPHAITLLFIPYMFFCFYRINKEPSSSESPHPMNSINNLKMISVFMGGLILQLFNPILLANPVLTRLVNLFLFRYSDKILFLISSFCGWLGGNILFIILIKRISSRIERNLPIDYTILRRYICRTFSLLLLFYCLFYLGRAPLPLNLPFLGNDIENNKASFAYINLEKRIHSQNLKMNTKTSMQGAKMSMQDVKRNTKTSMQDTKIYMPDAKIYMQDLKIYMQDEKISMHDEKIFMQDVNLKNAKISMHDVKIAMQDVKRNTKTSLKNAKISMQDVKRNTKTFLKNAKISMQDVKRNTKTSLKNAKISMQDVKRNTKTSLKNAKISMQDVKIFLKDFLISWFEQPWSLMLFDYNRSYRPIRYIGNSPFCRLGPVRTAVSQYFFGTYSSDGKQRISFTFLPSVLVLGEKLGKYRDLLDTSCSSEDPYHRWIHTMKKRRDYLENEFSDRVKALSNGSPVGNVMEKRVKFSNSQGDSFTEMYDPFLNGAFRGTINQLEFPGMLNDLIILNLSDFLEVSINDKFRYGYHISHHWQELEHENFQLPWEPLPTDTDTVRSLVPITKSSERGKVEPISKRRSLLAERIIPNKARKLFEEYLPNIDSWNIDSYLDNRIYPKRASCNERIYTNYLVNIYSRILVNIYSYSRIDDRNRNVVPTGTIKWELILSLFTMEQKVTSAQILFESLAQHEWTILRNFRGNVSTDDSTQTKDFLTLYKEILLNKPLQIREIRKHVPRFSSDFMIGKPDADDMSVDILPIGKIRSRKVKGEQTFDIGEIQVVKKRYSLDSDFRRNLIRGSMRARRRKVMICKRIQPNAHSPFFFVRMELPTCPKDYYDTSDSDRVNMEQVQEEFRERIQIKKHLEEPHSSISRVERLCSTRSILSGIRSVLLVTQSILRKRILLPSLIIAKNIGRILVFQVPEFSQDWEEMRKEVHFLCTPDGTEFSETEFPDKWLKKGMQIKLIFPFRLKPWHKSKKVRSEKKIRWSYLTMHGFETDRPFGNPIPKLGLFSKFFQPIFKELIFKRFKKELIIFKKLKRGLNRILFQKLKRRLMGSTGIRRVPRVRYIGKSEPNDRIQNKLLTETTPMGSANDSSEVNDQFGYETQTINAKDPDDRTTTMKERIESVAIIKSPPIIEMSLMDSEINIRSKGSFNILESTLKKQLVQIRRIPGRFRIKSVQLIRKRFYSMKLMKLFLKRMGRDLLPSVIHFIGSNINFWIRSAWIRSTGNIAKIYGRIFIINNFISSINRGKITSYHSINEKIQDFEISPDQNMFSMSQAYVFHKIWQIRAMNRSYSKDLLKSRTQTSYPFIKKKIKELLDIQIILDHEKPQDLKENDWKQWLRCFDRYNLSPQIWSIINPQEWRNRVSKQCTCYEERFIPYEQRKDSTFATVMEPSLGLLQKRNKRYRYDLLSYSYLDSTKDLDIPNLTKYFDIPNFTKDSLKFEKRGSGLDLKSWLFPELFGKPNIYYTKSKPVQIKSFLQEEQDRKKIEEEEEREKTTNVLKQEIGVRSHVQNDKVEEKKTGKVEEKKTGKVEEKKTGKVEEKKTGKVEEKKTGKVEEKKTGENAQEEQTDEKKKLIKFFFNTKMQKL
uniref:Protein TIC 214 n=1 Tax=Cathaya argyrophylla TaxID=64686 RepID=E1CGU6_CATAR|nr:hypothetical protein CaarC_p068 [Cathaya argyrophylla]BAJ19656.1 hypothetical protein [Cathaya argyrophylla]